MSIPERIIGAFVGLLFRMFRRIDADRSSNFCGWAARRLGPLLPAHRIGRSNLQLAFPDKDRTWIEATLRNAWENLGRVAGEYVHLGELWDYDPTQPNAGRIETTDAQIFYDLRDDGKPALAFAAHLANWELPAVAAATHGLPSAALYRMPNNRAVAQQIARIREGLMGRLIASRSDAVFEMAAALERGEHVGMLVDQHFSRGVEVTFFGRPCRANPTLARLARQFDCPVVGVRVIRLRGNRFRVSGTGPIQVPRDAQGNVLVQELMQQITSIIERWIREHPGQWLWFHRRWR
ncbi:MAG: lipid A biosynthesis lauroyl acyltransferase [Acetobacteraceae bacterium]|nr:lipid A biosynthesis lauroyl acyltransferase [Acetobacteraceae bacterium]MBV8522049.1 lipid A biosynthesis lauroyl acyltransferase [Acetobacteraceae bacterium]